MMKIRLLLTLILCHAFGNSFAAGLMLSSREDDPRELLMNRLLYVEVKIDGLIAQTSVYQEFVNESDTATDAVYSFPLPPDARATQLLYWSGDKIYRAILKVREQATNPGTGDGGIAAKVNEYIGRNGIKIGLSNIPAHEIQRVRLDYISMCDYFEGEIIYKFPLETADFVTYPLEHVEFDIHVESKSGIVDFDIPTNPGFRVIQSENNVLALNVLNPKSYLDHDFEFKYSVEQSTLSVDFYSIANDSTDGHFGIVLRPEAKADAIEVLAKRMIFTLSNSNRMFGARLEQSIAAIKEALDFLADNDLFNIIIFNSAVIQWQPSPIPATAENIQAAKAYLDTIRIASGSRMDEALRRSLQQIQNSDFSNAILLFADGRSPVDPRETEAQNEYKTGIFPIGVGEDLDRSRLEMTAALNYGFVTYVDLDEGIKEKIVRLIKQVSRPVLADVVMEYGRADLRDILPSKAPSTYAGSYFFTTGRYQNAGQSGLSIAGKGATGIRVFDFSLNFSNLTTGPQFIESLWAKEKIDALEREIEIYGETQALKTNVIELSLTYNIRSRYTAYIADYQEEFDGDLTSTSVENEKTVRTLKTFAILSNYPNPFNPTTRIRFFLDAATRSGTKLIKIYNSVGQLVAVIDVSNFEAGWHEVRFDGRDMYGKNLPSGVYYVQLQVGNTVNSTIRISLLK